MGYRLDVSGFYPLNGFLLSEEPAEPASWETSLSTNSSDWQNCFTCFFLHGYLDDIMSDDTLLRKLHLLMCHSMADDIPPLASWTTPIGCWRKTPPSDPQWKMQQLLMACNQQYFQDSIYLNISVGQQLSHNYQVNVYDTYIYTHTSGTMWTTSHVLISIIIMTHVSILRP